MVEVLSGPPYIVNMKRRSFKYLIILRAVIVFSFSIALALRKLILLAEILASNKSALCRIASSLRTADVFPVVASLPPKKEGRKQRPEIRLRFAGYIASLALSFVFVYDHLQNDEKYRGTATIFTMTIDKKIDDTVSGTFFNVAHEHAPKYSGPIRCSQSIKPKVSLSALSYVFFLKGIALFPLPENNRIIERRNQKIKIVFKAQLYQNSNRTWKGNVYRNKLKLT